MDAPEPKPTKADYAKAAIGMDVPSINDALTQANALKAFESAQKNLKSRMKRIDLRERELAVQESYLGDKLKLSQRVSELERENETLKNKVWSLEHPKPGTYVPGQSVGIR
jgi:cell shape-determining protein MreC